MKLILRLIGYIKPYRKKVLISLSCSLVVTFLNLIPPWFIKIVIDDVIIKKNTGLLNLIVIGLVLVYVFRAILIGARTYLMAQLGQKVVYDLRTHIHRTLQRLSLSFYEKRETGRIMSRITNDVNALERVIVAGSDTMMVAMLTLLGISVILFRINWQLALFSMIPMPFLAISMYRFSQRAHEVYHRVRQKVADINALLQQQVSGIREIIGFAQEDREIKKFDNENVDYYHVNIQAAKLWAFFFPVIMFIGALGTALILWYGGQQVIQAKLTVGELVAFLTYLALFYQPIRELNMVNHMLQHGRAAGERVFQIIDTSPEVTEVKDAVFLPPHVQGIVEFKNVCFSYIQTEEVLHDINIKVKPGETIALVGPTGVGKTTLISLILRFYDVTKGAITIDGYDIRKLKLNTLRGNIGIVSQETFLFNVGVRENIAYSKMKVTENEIISAARSAHAHEFIVNLPDGYNTIVGERGVRLSVGEKQRISIARALLKDPPILILDEATSSVDSQTEILIQNALEHLMKNRTTFVIAHRLSTIRNADRIVVIDKGRIIEVGNHEELIKRQGLYSQLHEAQFKFS